MGKYAYIKKVDADWLSVAMQHLKFRIKMLVLRCSLKRKDYVALKKTYILPMAQDLIEDVDNDNLKQSCYAELLAFADSVYEEMEKVASVMSPKEIALALLPPNFLTSFQKQEVGDSRQVLVNLEKETSYQLAEAIKKARPNGFKGSAYTRATPNDTYYPEVHDATKKWIQNIFDIKTPNKPFIANVNPRAYAEMNVRYEKYKADKESLIAQGVKLVLVPAHANCSKRCQRYQGKIYSLDGTSGSVAGHNYVPIEDVSDKVTYTSKSTGRTYFAGLFSYNCRHTLQPYKEGQLIEEIPDEVIEKQREIEERQRQMERNYRTMREKASILREIANESGNEQLKKVAHQMDIQASLQRKEYVMYCQANEVPMYPERLKLIDGEGIYLRNGAKRDLDDLQRINKIVEHKVYVEDVNGTGGSPAPENPPTPSTPQRPIAQGRNIVGEVIGNEQDSMSLIAYVINKQGFDGLPLLLEKDDFDKLVEKTGFFAMRTYAGNTQEQADMFQNELYNGRFYVDCSEGGSQYGQGMYFASSYDITNESKLGNIALDMKSYIGQNKYFGNEFAKVEAITFRENTNILTVDASLSNSRYEQEILNMYVEKLYEKYASDDYQKKLLLKDVEFDKEITKKDVEIDNAIRNGDMTLANKLYFEKKEIEKKQEENGKNIDTSHISDIVRRNISVDGDIYGTRKNIGILATEMGYDAIHVVDNENEIDYTIILNRSKIAICKGGKSKYGRVDV